MARSQALDTSQLIEYFQSIRIPQVVAIDGFTFSGKTTLAKVLSKTFGYSIFDFDSFIRNQSGKFTTSFDFERFQSAYGAASCPKVISGICMRLILEKLSIEPDLNLYIKRVSETGLWTDDYRNFDRLEEQDQISTCLGLPPSSSSFEIEIIKYHIDYCPDSKSDIIVERVETPNRPI